MALPVVSHLPADLFLSRDVFIGVLNQGWNLMSDHKKDELLNKFMPESLDLKDKSESISMLLQDDLTKFDVNPVDSMYLNLKINRLAPDICKSMEDVKRLQLDARKLKEKENQMILWSQILCRRKRLLKLSLNCSPDDPIGREANGRHLTKRKSNLTSSDGHKLCHNSFPVTEKIRKRVEKRFRDEMRSLSSLTVITSEDEEEDLSLESDDDVLDCIPVSNGLKSERFREQTDNQRYMKLLLDFQRKKKKKRSKSEHHLNSVCDASNSKNGELSQIIARVSGNSCDRLVLTSPPPPPVCHKKKRNSNAATRKIASTKTPAHKSIKKEPLSPTCDSKPLVPGIELMSRKLDLNLNSFKKEKKTADVFDFDDDSPSESQAPTAVSTPAASLVVPQTTSSSSSKHSSDSTATPSVTKSLQEVLQQIHQHHVASQPVNPVSVTVSSKLPNCKTQQPDRQTHLIGNRTDSSFPPTTLHVQAAAQSSEIHHMSQPAANLQTYVPCRTPVQNQAALIPQITPTLNETMPQPVQHVQQNHTKTKTPPPVVYEDPPPASFFSLIRDVFRTHAQPDYKLTLHKLEELVKDRLRTINPSLGWNHESVQSAMNFLSYFTDPNHDTEIIPLVDYKEKNQQWQWIGQGRDLDSVLVSMAKEWLSEKDRSSSVIDPSQPIPPAAWPTEWTVKPSTGEERKQYREQEAVRYNNPNKAFTYRIHSYESVVGPVKGCGVGVTVSTPPSQSPNKAREHSLLVSDRPPFVTLLSLVRDAAARLPNGEGTRADICELLKDSQYLLPTVSDQQINSIVSGALDRLHYEKDPCVKYDVNRKVWIYLHRNRSEGDFERLHEMQIAAAKAKKTLSKKGKPFKSSTSPPVNTSPKQIQQKKNVPTDNTIVTPITASGQTRISISPLVASPVQDSTDKTILNILNQAHGVGPPIFPKKKPVTEVQVVHNVCTPNDDASVTSTIASVVRPVAANNVVSMIPVSGLTGNRLIASADSKDKVQRLIQQNASLQKLTSKPAISVLPARPQQTLSVSNDDRKPEVTLPSSQSHKGSAGISVADHVIPNQSLNAQHVAGQQAISIQSGTQITVPGSVIFGSRPGQVVLGKNHTVSQYVAIID